MQKIEVVYGFLILNSFKFEHFSNGEASTVRLGAYDLSTTSNSQAKDYSIESFIRHEDYDAQAKQNDIALIKLSQDVRIDSKIRPVCLWQTADIDQTKVIASGWGVTAYNGESSTV